MLLFNILPCLCESKNNKQVTAIWSYKREQHNLYHICLIRFGTSWILSFSVAWNAFAAVLSCSQIKYTIIKKIHGHIFTF